MKALTKGRGTFPEYMKHGTFDNTAYSKMTLIQARKQMVDKVQPAKILLKCRCQLIGVEDEKDLL